MHASSATPQFSAATTFEGRAAIVSLRGGVDDVAAFELATIINVAIAGKPASLTLALAEVIFIGEAGLVVISNAESRLVGAGMVLTIRSPSALVNHHLGSAEKATLEQTPPGNGHLAPGGGHADGSRRRGRRAQPRGRTGPRQQR